MRTLVKGRGEESYIWYHVVHDDRRDNRYFAKRLYLHIGDQVFGFYLSLFTDLALIGLQFSSTSDEDFDFSFAIYKLFYFGFSVEHLKIVHRLPGVKWDGKWGSGEREIRLSWRPWSWHWNIWTYPNESRSSWRDNWFDLTDFLLGREKYTDRTISTHETAVAMPEGAYPAKVRLFESTWRRSRWPWPRRMLRAEVEVEGGVPVPGKGENSWDMDDDAIFSSVTPAATVDEALQALRASALRDRRRYAGENWTPDSGWPAHCVRV